MNIRKLTGRAGFEFIFAVGIAAIFIIPTAVMAQNHKNLEINISNGDTVINGKNIKDMDAQQRKEALADLNKITGHRGVRQEVRIDQRMDGEGDLGSSNLNIERGPDGEFIVKEPGNNKPLHMKRMFKDTMFTFKFDNGDQMPNPGEAPKELRMMRPRAFNLPYRMGNDRVRRNSQHFNYTNTDDNGITTNVSYSVSEPRGEHSETKSELNINDIKLVPEFSTGKTILMFNLPAKATAEVQLTDSKGNLLWSEKTASASFSKSFSLGLNGIYQLKVKQSGKEVVKEILKEE